MKNNIKLNDVISKGEFIKTLNPSDKEFRSQADLYLWKENYYVIRTIGKQYDLSGNQLIRLERNLKKYYSLLKKHLNLALPEIFASSINKQKGVVLLITDFFQNGSIVKILPTDKKVRHLKTTALALIELISSEKNINAKNKLICSLDTNPENFFLNKKGKVVYNDFTPPLFRDTKDVWFEFRRKDEIHVSKAEKEKRYFGGVNLLLNFINKVRIYLPFTEYIKFIKWASKIIKEEKALNNLSIYPKIFEEIDKKPMVKSCYKFKNYAGKRDLLRFSLSLNKKLSPNQIKEIYKK